MPQVLRVRNIVGCGFISLLLPILVGGMLLSFTNEEKREERTATNITHSFDIAPLDFYILRSLGFAIKKILIQVSQQFISHVCIQLREAHLLMICRHESSSSANHLLSAVSFLFMIALSRHHVMPLI